MPPAPRPPRKSPRRRRATFSRQAGPKCTASPAPLPGRVDTSHVPWLISSPPGWRIAMIFPAAMCFGFRGESAMRIFAKFALIAVAAGLSVVGGSDNASARRWDPVGKCYPPIDGVGTGHGVFGRGSARARAVARSNWEAAAASQYGYAYSRLYLAQGVQWDCKKLAILTAKCVVTAKPCSARLRG